MAALDFPNSPTVGQVYTAGSGAKYTWDGAVWTLGGPITASPVGAAGGDLGSTYPNPTVVKAQAGFAVGSSLMTVASTGTLTVPGGSATDSAALICGKLTNKARITPHPTIDDLLSITVNRRQDSTGAWTNDDASKPSWTFVMDGGSSDQCRIMRGAAGAGGAATNLLSVDGTTGKTVCTLVDNSVTRPMLAGTWATSSQPAAIPTSFTVTGSPNAYNTWIKVIDFPAITTKGNRVFLAAGPGLLYNCLSATGCAVGQLFRRSGTDVGGSGAWVTIGVAGIVPLPTHQGQDQPAAGTYTYSYWVYLAGNTSATITVNGNGAAWCWATEMP